MEMRSNGSPSNSSSSSTRTQIHPPETISRSDPNTTYPTTYVTADTSSFKKVVQDLTSNHCPTLADVLLPPRSSAIPAVKTSTNKKKGFKLYERRNRVLMISPLAADQRTPEMVSPSTLDFPSLTLISPATSCSSAGEEEKSIGFYLYPSPRESEPTLLPLFPVTSPAEKPRNSVE